MINNELLEQIKILISNKTHFSPHDGKKVACMLFKSLQERKFNLGDTEDTIEALPGEFSESVREQLNEIAFVIYLLTDC